MNRYRFPLSVAGTSLAIVLILVGVSALVIQSAFASSPFMGAAVGAGAPWTHGGPWNGNKSGWQLPAQLTSLADVPAADRFSHFRGVQVQLTDKDNRPFDVDVIPGTATAVTQTSISVATNDGANRTFSIDDKTVVHAGSHGQSNQANAVKQNDHIVVVALNNSNTAMAVVVADGEGFGPGGPFRH